MAREFPVTKDGYFGRKSRHRVRAIDCVNVVKTAERFYSLISRGGSHEEFPNNKGITVHRATLADGTVIVYRQITSSKGSPAVEININKPGWIKTQKIHFVERPTLW